MSSTVETILRYLGRIQDCPLLWDNVTHGPVWPEGEPMRWSMDEQGSITIEAQCDVYQAWWGAPGKLLTCGHLVQAPEPYLTWMETGRETCLSCAAREGS